jgi:hypothetical protein
VTPAYGYARRGPGEGVSPVVWRVAGEAAFLIAVAVVVGLAKLDWWLILLVMASAFVLVLLIELAAGREGHVAAPRIEPTQQPPVVEGEAVGEKTEEEESLGWTAFAEAQEPSDAMTMVGAPPVAEPEPVAEEAEPAAEAEPEAEPEEEPETEPAAEAEPEPEEELESEPEEEPEPELAADAEAQPSPEEHPRRRWWRRRADVSEEAPDVAEQEPPRHVRVLASDESEEAEAAVDQWERGFDEPGDLPEDETGEDVVAAADVDSAETEPAVTGDGEQSRRRFRRR